MSFEKGIELIIGPMFCDKTSEFIRRIRREKIAGRNCQSFKPILENRYGEEIISHNKDKLKCFPVDSLEELKQKLKKETEVIGIDEIQFFEDNIINFLVDNQINYHFITAGLPLDFRGEAFKFKKSEKHIGELMPYCRITYLNAICTYSVNEKICGKNAYFSQRFIDGKLAHYDSPLVLVGGKEYEARCMEHFHKPIKGEKNKFLVEGKVIDLSRKL